jgi:amidohydrolase
MSGTVRSAVEAIEPWLVETRRDFHMNPELSFEEHRTSDLAADSLEGWGIEVKRGVAQTGVVGLLSIGRPGPTIGIRADMDALPIVEENDVPYKSKAAGKMHACGHDAHTTMLLGAARVLAENPSLFGDVGGNVKFLFQPAEEGLAGGRRMVDQGVLENPKVDLVLATHVIPVLPVGTIGTRPGPMMAATDRLTLILRGKGSHAAHPHLSRDPVLAATHMATALQGIVSRNVNPFDSVVVSVTQLEAGQAFNIIPEEAILRGTIRTMSPETRDMARKRVVEISEGIASAFQVEAKCEIEEGYPVLVNHAGATKLVEKAAESVVGPENLLSAPPVMGSEDFAYMINERPGALFRLGIRNEEREIVHSLHSNRFDLDEKALAIGVTTFVMAALEFLANSDEYVK